LHHSLFLQNLSLWVHLGCTAEERARKQEVRVSIEFRFLKIPGGSMTDDLKDTICYAKVSQVMAEHCLDRHFNLVEKLGYELCQIIKQKIEGQAHIALRVHKVAPPVEGLIGGVVYCVSDF
jgi:dihydroneopterin aldolase